MARRRMERIARYSPSFLPFTVLFHLMMCLVRVIDGLFFRLKIEGREHLEGLGKGILVSNHTLLMDPAVIAHAIRPRRSYFTMLAETATIPFLGTFVRLLGGIPIPRCSASVRILEHGLAEALSALGFVHFFPEGECYRWNQAVRPFRPGAFLLALRLAVPVVPLAIVLHEQRVLGRRSIRLLGRMIRVPPRVVVVIGSPILPEPDGRGASRGDPGRSPGLRRKAEALAEAARVQVQCAIDERGGSRSLYRGPMPRLTRSAKAANAVNAAIPTGR